MDSFSLEDALIRMAPIVSESSKGRARDKYIRIKDDDTGRLFLYMRSGDDYYMVDEVPNMEDEDSLRLRDNYFVINTPNQSNRMKELVINSSESLNTLVGKIKSLMRRNTIQMRIKC